MDQNWAVEKDGEFGVLTSQDVEVNVASKEDEAPNFRPGTIVALGVDARGVPNDAVVFIEQIGEQNGVVLRVRLLRYRDRLILVALTVNVN